MLGSEVVYCMQNDPRTTYGRGFDHAAVVHNESAARPPGLDDAGAALDPLIGLVDFHLAPAPVHFQDVARTDLHAFRRTGAAVGHQLDPHFVAEVLM
jgi:hypothetical protein